MIVKVTPMVYNPKSVVKFLNISSPQFTLSKEIDDMIQKMEERLLDKELELQKHLYVDALWLSSYNYNMQQAVDAETLRDTLKILYPDRYTDL